MSSPGERPLVSIIIPCWNAEAYLGEAIESALAQTYPDIEVIVIDDGSTDGSFDVIKSYGDRIRWVTGPNRGGSAARNRGLEIAQGTLVQFLDSDDQLHPAALEQMVRTLVRTGDTPLCDWEEVLEAKPGKSTPFRSNYGGEDPLIFFLRNTPLVSALLHWKKALESVGGFDEALPCSQEKDLHLRLAARGMRLVHVPEVLYRYRRRSGSVSSDYLKILKEHLRIHRKLYAMLLENGGLSAERQRTIAEVIAKDARHLVRRGNPLLGETYFLAAAEIDRGGAMSAFGNPFSRVSAAIIGPVKTEVFVQRAVRLGSFLSGASQQ